MLPHEFPHAQYASSLLIRIPARYVGLTFDILLFPHSALLHTSVDLQLPAAATVVNRRNLSTVWWIMALDLASG
jgi:hypothetical protein